MPDDIIIETPRSTDPPAPPPRVEGGRMTCEMCGCQLAPSGQVLRRGERAKVFMDLADDVEKRDKTIAALTSENEALRAQVRELSGTKKRGLLDF